MSATGNPRSAAEAYARRFAEAVREGGPVPPLVKLGEGSVNLVTPDGTHTVFDAEGRLWSSWSSGSFHRRAMDGRVLLTEHTSAGARARPVPWEERESLFASARERAAEGRRLIEAGEAHALPDPESLAPAAEVLERVDRWTPARLEAESARFSGVYSPVGMLPPDQYLAVVLQLTEGCAWGECTFCTLYRGVKFRVRGEAELAAHAKRVSALFGRAIGMRRSVFLGSADALSAEAEEVEVALRIAKREFPRQMDASSGGGASSFATAESVLCAVDSLDRLAAAGLGSVCIGLESGSDEVLEKLNKPHGVDEVADAVEMLKCSGIAVRLTVLAGVDSGGPEGERHVEETAEFLGRLPLGPEDIVYISPLCSSGSPPSRAALAQVEEIRAALDFPPRAPVVATYRVDAFVY